jgi:hypothetical protein
LLIFFVRRIAFKKVVYSFAGNSLNERRFFLTFLLSFGGLPFLFASSVCALLIFLSMRFLGLIFSFKFLSFVSMILLLAGFFLLGGCAYTAGKVVGLGASAVSVGASVVSAGAGVVGAVL